VCKFYTYTLKHSSSLTLVNMAKNKKKDYIYAVGRRREASARIRLFKGKGQTVVNGKPIEEYFPGAILKDAWTKPFKVVDTLGSYYATVKVSGGGKMGQLDAVVHGIAKALSLVKKNDFRTPLKKSGLLTRDARIRERRKVGMGGKARRKKQSPKR
jgi:small subunit ribosomal protein S9